MGDEPYTTQRATSASNSSGHSTSPHLLAYASQRAEVLFGSYRRGDANNPDRYVAAVAAVLSSYDADLMREVTDPRTGIQATEKFMSFMPNAGELKVYCDGVAAVRARIERLGALPRVDFSRARLPRPEPAPGDLATVFVPINNSRCAELIEWAKTGDRRRWKYDSVRPGIWVSYDTWDNRRATARSIGQAVGAVVTAASPDPSETRASPEPVR